jgi:3-oxoadipate enol-lactonase
MQYKNNYSKINANNLEVSFTDEGPRTAPSIIFIHGFPLNKSMWENQAESIKESHRVITYDIRGHGNTNSGSEAYSIDLFVNDLIGLMDALNIEKTNLCGLSTGGSIALKAFENYPKRFLALILCDTNCTADSPETSANRMRTIHVIEAGTVGKYADESLKKFFTPDAFNTHKTTVELVRDMIVETTKPSLCKTLQALADRKETCSKLNEIKVPVLILVGSEDQITPPESARHIHDKITGSTLHIIKNAGHLSNLEDPSEFNNQLKKFLATMKLK